MTNSNCCCTMFAFVFVSGAAFLTVGQAAAQASDSRELYSTPPPWGRASNFVSSPVIHEEVTTGRTQCCFTEDCSSPWRETPYCCGNKTVRACCNNTNLDFWVQYRDTARCTCSGCFYTGWESLFGVLAIILFTFMLALCCCTFIKRAPWPCKDRVDPAAPRAHRSARVGSRNIPTVSAAINEEALYAQTGFSPHQQFAFTPPDYETVCKDLPRYEDLEATAQRPSGAIELREVSGVAPGGATNVGFMGDPEGNDRRNSPPPEYGEGSGNVEMEREGTVSVDVREEIHADSPPPPY